MSMMQAVAVVAEAMCMAATLQCLATCGTAPGKWFLEQLFGVDAKHEPGALIHMTNGKVLVQLNNR
jgi:hypothetical protein